MPHRKLTERLQAASRLSDDDRNKLASLPFTVKRFGDHDYLLRDGDRSFRCAVVVNGFLFRQKTVIGGTQILSFYVPGDMPDLHTLYLPLMDHDLCSAGSSEIAFVSHQALREMLAHSPALTAALWRETLVDAAIYREWVANLGSRDALSRVAHLICEFAARLNVVGLVQNDRFLLPFTQSRLAHACGLSSVHLNRTVQELRHRGLIHWEGRTMALLERDELEKLGDFSPDYLHLEGDNAPREHAGKGTVSSATTRSRGAIGGPPSEP